MKRTKKLIWVCSGLLVSVVTQGAIVDFGASEVAEAATEVQVNEKDWQVYEAIEGYAMGAVAGSWRSGVVGMQVGLEGVSEYSWEDQPLRVIERLGDKSSEQLEELGKAVRRVGHHMVSEVKSELAGNKGREETLSSIVAVPESSLTVWAALFLVLALPMSVLLRRGQSVD